VSPRFIVLEQGEGPRSQVAENTQSLTGRRECESKRVTTTVDKSSRRGRREFEFGRRKEKAAVEETGER
jgi:hypothetical protein